MAGRLALRPPGPSGTVIVVAPRSRQRYPGNSRNQGHQRPALRRPGRRACSISSPSDPASSPGYTRR